MLTLQFATFEVGVGWFGWWWLELELENGQAELETAFGWNGQSAKVGVSIHLTFHSVPDGFSRMAVFSKSDKGPPLLEWFWGQIDRGF